MIDESLKHYYEILELDSDASREDIARAYKHLKNLYSKTSMATAPVDKEWTESDKRTILEQVEDAYLKLLLSPREERVNEYAEGPTITPLDESQPKEEPVIAQDEYRPNEEPAVSIDFDEEEPSKQEPGIKEELFDSFVEEEVLLFDLEKDSEVDEVKVDKEDTQEKPVEVEKDDTQAEKFIGGIDAQPISGAVLKELREKQELGLLDLADSTQVPVETLEAMEAEAFDKLPEAGYLRYYVTSYARALGLPAPKDAADQYMKRFREQKKGAGFAGLS